MVLTVALNCYHFLNSANVSYPAVKSLIGVLSSENRVLTTGFLNFSGQHLEIVDVIFKCLIPS